MEWDDTSDDEPRFESYYQPWSAFQSQALAGNTPTQGRLDSGVDSVLVEEGSGRILGAHLLGPHADEVINLFAMAMRAGVRAPDVKTMLFSYPTNASDIPYMV